MALHQLPEVPGLSQHEFVLAIQNCHPVVLGKEGGRDKGKSETNESGSMFALSSKKCPTFPRGGREG